MFPLEFLCSGKIAEDYRLLNFVAVYTLQVNNFVQAWSFHLKEPPIALQPY